MGGTKQKMTTMNKESKILSAEGCVSAALVGADGTAVSFVDSKNTTTYAAADVVAMAYAGDSAYIPRYIAFIYGPQGSSLDGIDAGRATSWSSVEQACRTNNLGISVTPFSYKPTVDASDAGSDDRVYNSNRVTFHGRTQNIAANNCVFKACLLGKGYDDSQYCLLALVDLGKNGTYKEKPEDFELAVDWAVTFK